MAVDLGMGVDTRITASLHPQSVASMDEYDSDTEGELQQVVQAFTSVYEGIGKVLDVRDVAAGNTAWNEDMRTIKDLFIGADRQALKSSSPPPWKRAPPTPSARRSATM